VLLSFVVNCVNEHAQHDIETIGSELR
jgi:hypothetical protein